MKKIVIILSIFSFDRLKLYFFKKKKNNRNKEAIINLREAMLKGLNEFKLIFIAIKAEPHIALNKINRNKLFEYTLLSS